MYPYIVVSVDLAAVLAEDEEVVLNVVVVVVVDAVVLVSLPGRLVVPRVVPEVGLGLGVAVVGGRGVTGDIVVV